MEPYFDPDRTKKCVECKGYEFYVLGNNTIVCINCGKKFKMPSREFE